MNNPYHILDKPVPLSQNFEAIKAKGLSYIQEYCGTEWTNFNPSDPGITILDQVCYALTELGYCIDFPVNDILTDKNGVLDLENQFYTAEQILTSSPITILDYRKYLIDGVKAIENVVFEPINSYISEVSRVYRVHLYINPAISDLYKADATNDKATPIEIDLICQEAFYLLNKSRNWGELFLMPKPLKNKTEKLFGTIEIDKLANATKILGNIREAIEELIFPRVKQKGYDVLKEENIDTNDIFNGPLLKNGWISNSDIKAKPSVIHAEELAHLMSQIEGVVDVNDISFAQSPEVHELTCKLNELLTIDLGNSIASQSLNITCKGTKLYSGISSSEEVSIAPRKLQVSDIGSSIQVKADLPKGDYRDINSYYSIQNTFPEVFAVGSSSTESNASPLQIAQSRQLRGYLTLFDQQLANQFSQLANVPQLFSFINSISGDPTDKKQYYDQQSKLSPDQQAYPVPYLKFSPTYFYQSLYDTPSIKPLLKNEKAFEFSLGFVSRQDMENKAWSKYKNAPYNSYIWGLMQIVEDEQVSLERRNEILDHLLARHGESPILINSIIDASIYTGDIAKGQLVFKSLLLQNLGLLSYYRQKAVDYIGADQLDSTLKEIPNRPNKKWFQTYNIDFVFDSQKVDQQERITNIDFVNYSALELQLNLLFGLNTIYKNYIYESIETIQANPLNDTEQNLETNIKLALWMTENRKGLISIEPSLLVQSLHFQIAYCEGDEQPEYHIVKERANYHATLGIEQLFRVDLQKPNIKLSESTQIMVSDQSFSVVKTNNCKWAEGLWQTIPGTKNKIAIGANLGTKNPIGLNHSIFKHSAMLFMPDFIPQFTQAGFNDRMDIFLESMLPVHVESNLNMINSDQLSELIPIFCNWRNSLRGLDGDKSEQLSRELELKKNAIELISLMTDLHDKKE